MKRRLRRMVSLVCALALCLGLLPAGALPAKAAPSAQTVEGVSPVGTTINVFDYWVNERGEAGRATDGSTDKTSGINAGGALKFGAESGGNGSNINIYTGQGAGPYRKDGQGMVKKTLNENGFPVLRDGLSAGNNITVSAGNQNLDYLFSTTSAQGKVVYEDAKGLLQIDGDGYYYYNASQGQTKEAGGSYETANFAVLGQENGVNQFTLYDTWGVKGGSNSADKGQGMFFPFDGDATQDTTTDTALHNYFGMTMTTQFIQQYGGYTRPEGDSNRKPITYEFSGDDDVWVFIDGVLVADLGGNHDAVKVEIDFSTGTVKLSWKDANSQGSGLVGEFKVKKTAYFEDIFAGTGLELESVADGTSADPGRQDAMTLADNSYHTLKFFYLERGGASNMSMKFNLSTIPSTDVVKVDQNGEAVSGAEFALYAVKGEQYPTATVDNAGNVSWSDGGSASPVLLAEGRTGSDGALTLTEIEDGSSTDKPLSLQAVWDEHTDTREPTGSGGLTWCWWKPQSPMATALTAAASTSFTCGN